MAAEDLALTWQLTPKNLFFSKGDKQDLRLGDFAQAFSLSEELSSDPTSSVVILGYPDDEGIRLNGGRPGAALAPDRIRYFLYKMTPSVLSEKSIHWLDMGNLKSELPLIERHRQAEKAVFSLCQKNLFFFSLGGGHDYGFPDAAGFVESELKQGQRPVVINFDAHLDVRPFQDQPHSGTPFYRLLEKYNSRFDFVEVGLQNHCNSRSHYEWAKNQGAHFLFLDQIKPTHLFSQIENLIPLKNRRLFVSLDMDCLRSSEAPGCSASYPTGLSATHLMECLVQIKKQTHLKGLGVYEVSPPLDVADHTSQLTALILHRMSYSESLA